VVSRRAGGVAIIKNLLFLKKKKKKDLMRLPRRYRALYIQCGHERDLYKKVFWFFLSKKNALADH
jgi:hypothetical protein